ncbi:hypothetical protein [Bacillus xiapuensis]|uniref:Uncharacterized protein n=1 Tax=Bacillus xiapuensis TaxID=2014075 RepID=A0ABU6N8A3_9BACI|nr:hypothetical protein [Bacillus xiapuensis]
MFITVKYDIPVSDFDVIPEGTKLEIDPTWNEHEGFIAVKYRGGSLYFNALYFEDVPALIEVG